MDESSQLGGDEFKTIAGLLYLIAELTRELSKAAGAGRTEATSLAGEVEVIAGRYETLTVARIPPHDPKRAYQ